MPESMSAIRLILPIYGTDQDDCSSSRNRAYFIGTDSRGREFEIILASDDEDDDLWVAVHALQTRYRKNS